MRLWKASTGSIHPRFSHFSIVPIITYNVVIIMNISFESAIGKAERIASNRNNVSIELSIIYRYHIFMTVLSIGARYGDQHYFYNVR